MHPIFALLDRLDADLLATQAAADVVLNAQGVEDWFNNRCVLHTSLNQAQLRFSMATPPASGTAHARLAAQAEVDRAQKAAQTLMDTTLAVAAALMDLPVARTNNVQIRPTLWGHWLHEAHTTFATFLDTTHALRGQNTGTLTLRTPALREMATGLIALNARDAAWPSAERPDLPLWDTTHGGTRTRVRAVSAGAAQAFAGAFMSHGHLTSPDTTTHKVGR